MKMKTVTEQTADKLAAHTLEIAIELAQSNKELARQLAITTREVASNVESVTLSRFSSIRRWNYCLLAFNFATCALMLVLTTNFIQFMQSLMDAMHRT